MEPINAANREAFDRVRERIIAELEGEVPDEEKILSLDPLPEQQSPEAPESGKEE